MTESRRRAAGALEAEVMEVLQRAARPLNAADVQDLLASELAYTTVVTILSRMYDKGVLTRVKDGRAYRYAPVSDEPGLVARRMYRVLANGPDREAVLARFVDALSEQDERLLRALLDGR
jgi:predicted transcriptional regulator